jgi:UDPglucose 6-dehydrogenase
MGRAAEVLPPGRVSYADSSYDACLDADALLILTDWEEFRSLDLTRVSACLQYPVIVDGRNMFDLDVMRGYGFFYYSMGRPDIVEPEFNPAQDSSPGRPRQEENQCFGMAASFD